jgi:hypothetical protein
MAPAANRSVSTRTGPARKTDRRTHSPRRQANLFAFRSCINDRSFTLVCASAPISTGLQVRAEPLPAETGKDCPRPQLAEGFK